MLVGVMIWALAHLLANGDAGGMLLFASFFAWAVYDRIAVATRGDLGAAPQSDFTRADVLALAIGTVVYAAVLALHPWLFGVNPFG
jgi:uncharacterized membrane protein